MTNDPLRVLDLFSGIGGFSLGLETISDDSLLRDRQIRAESASETLADGSTDRRHPEVERAVEAAATADVIVGGFPCQDISVAGKRAGIDGSRSGLWAEMRRTIGLVRPRYVIVENVPALLSGDGGRWFHRVLGDLAALGYDAEWHCLPACAVGAPHIRDRVWIIADAPSEQVGAARQSRKVFLGVFPNSNCKQRRTNERKSDRRADRRNNIGGMGENVPNSNSDDEHRRRSLVQVGRCRCAEKAESDGIPGRTEWSIEPDVGRVAHGVPSRVDRLKCLGNAVVPEIVRLIGRAILERAR